MKKIINLRGIGILALAAVLMFALSGCGDTDPDNGPVKYTVTFNANGGTVSPSSIEVESGKTVASLPTPTKTTVNTYFGGWYTKNGTTSGDWGSLFTTASPVTASITVYARWEELVVETRQLTEANWRAILTEIKTAGKYVNLDLSACTLSDASTGGGLRSDGTFDPIDNFEDGKKYIVSLILPNAATSIVNGNIATHGNHSFRSFSQLTSISASAITSIGDGAFYGCTSLTSLNFPATISIRDSAFYDCTSLTSVSFPAATSIGDYAFYRCTSLASVSFPAATSIGNWAFFDCTSLASVSFPAVTTIWGWAFGRCTSLTSVSFPAAISIGSWAFLSCTSLTSVNIPAVPYIHTGAFASTGSITLTINLGLIAPNFGYYLFGAGEISAKSVTVKVPTGATGYGDIPATYSGTDTTENWGNGFRGGGWTGNGFVETGSVKSNITLFVQYQE